ncbi:hypothetical protein ACH4T9_19955 [Micromonospora sp. NPDC020750]|uniref:hypothetical protein n=1 Tax=unclassified Micromonospora TaxID=2617518 RepID=UPI003793D96F
MNLGAVAEELRAALGVIEGLNVAEWGVKRVQSPAAVVSLPERVDYDATYGRGSDQLTDMAVLVLIARPTDPATLREVATYADGSGPRSVKAAIEAHTYTSCDSVTVVSAEFERVSYADIEYLAAMFRLDITGRGA